MTAASPQSCNASITLKKKPSEYLNQLYFDALLFMPEGLRHLQCGAPVRNGRKLDGSELPNAAMQQS